MCFLKLALMCSIIAASVVDLPQPVEPATSTMPRGDSAIFLHLLQQAQFLEAGHIGFDVAHGQTPLAALLKQIGAEAADARHEIGEIHLAFLLDLFAQVRGRMPSTTLFIQSCGRVRTLDGDQLAIDAEDDRRADLQMDVRRVAVHGRLQNLVEHFHAGRLTNPRAGTKAESKGAERCCPRVGAQSGIHCRRGISQAGATCRSRALSRSWW